MHPFHSSDIIMLGFLSEVAARCIKYIQEARDFEEAQQRRQETELGKSLLRRDLLVNTTSEERYLSGDISKRDFMRYLGSRSNEHLPYLPGLTLLEKLELSV
jgi:hypothetical protein